MTDRHAAEAREKARQEKNVYKARALKAEARNAALLEALRWYAETDFTARGDRARAAIAAAEGEA